MRKFSVLSRFDFLFLTVALFLSSTPLAAQRRHPGLTAAASTAATVAQPRVFSVKGWVAQAGNHTRIENVRVELHALTGPIVGQAFTGANGDFEFELTTSSSHRLNTEQ